MVIFIALATILSLFVAAGITSPSTKSGKSYIYKIPIIRERLGLSGLESLSKEKLTLQEVEAHSLFQKLHVQHSDLAEELGKLPEFTDDNISDADVEALEDIVILAAQSTNPEVKEAFDLMLKGGTPKQRDFRYSVPSYNTELEVLFWLAEQNEFKENDTLAQAIAMVHGLWVTMGDDEVRKAVYEDANDLLNFFRETSKIQEATGYHLLENYPLEAKVYLCWRGNDLGRGGHVHYRLMSGGRVRRKAVNIHILYENRRKRVTLSDYKWNNVGIDTLRKMREYVNTSRWSNRNIDRFVKNLEDYFYFSRNWIFTQPDDAWLTYKGEKTVNHNMNNANLEFDHFLKTGKGIGVCDDEMTIVDAFLKSVGIPSGAMVRTYGTKDGSNHTHVFYYEPSSKTWKSYGKQLSIGLSPNWNVYLFKVPVIQHNYYKYHRDNQQRYMKMLDLYHKILRSPGYEIKEMFLVGVPTSQMKEWLRTKM